MKISKICQSLFLLCVLVTVALWPGVSTDQMDSGDQATENTLEEKYEEEYEDPDSGSCAADRDCGKTQNQNIYHESASEKEIKEFLQPYGITEELFDLDGKVRIDIVLEKAKLFVEDEGNENFSHLSEAEKKLYFVTKVKELMDIVVRERIERQKEDENKYEFPKLRRIEPGQVGDVVEVELEEGAIHKRITRGVYPPVFEIPDFLLPEECDFIIQKAADLGLELSHLFGADVTKELEEENESDVSRISRQAWLRTDHLGEDFTRTLHSRIAKLTDLPVDVVKRGEHMQVVNYEPGGHYHAHLDTIDDDVLPCCFQHSCGEAENTPEWGNCCRLCRYITVLYYLNDVELGGETAFPLVDMPDDLYDEKMTNVPEQKWYNLSQFCYNSSLIVKPKKGTAVMWYSHFVDEDGYLGKADLRSHHGGCDILKGTKWVANTWISATTYANRFKPSLFYN